MSGKNHRKLTYKQASEFIIEFYKYAREKGIYEDRIMRKLIAFVSSRIYLSDCGATGGNQIVITPDGAVGICHGCMKEREFFPTTVDDIDFEVNENSDFLSWSKLSPLNNDECLACEALGICGGGCPINARNNDPKHSIQALDERFCVHAKSTLAFFIEDLFKIINK